MRYCTAATCQANGASFGETKKAGKLEGYRDFDDVMLWSVKTSIVNYIHAFKLMDVSQMVEKIRVSSR